MKLTGNEPAMPCMDTNNIEGHEVLQLRYTGLTIRQQFAAMAMQGILTNSMMTENAETDSKWIAEASILCADALIKELNKEESSRY